VLLMLLLQPRPGLLPQRSLRIVVWCDEIVAEGVAQARLA
jgi:hypothetical protein